MKVGVVGNCQSNVTADWLKLMLPEDEIVHHSIARPPETYPAAADELRGCDVIISQFVGNDHGPLSTNLLKQAGRRYVMVPNLAFTGLQPDMTYLYASGQPVASPLGPYHSKIVISCFRLGLDAGRTRSLFNGYIYFLLGYFDEYDKAEAYFDRGADEVGFGLRTRDLAARGCFMHTINHGNVEANRLIAWHAARVAGLSAIADPGPMPDELAEDAVWPLYPEIAARLNMAGGGTTFITPTHMAHGGPRERDLDQFIAASFATYAADVDAIDFAPIQPQIEAIGKALRNSYQ